MSIILKWRNCRIASTLLPHRQRQDGKHAASLQTAARWQACSLTTGNCRMASMQLPRRQLQDGKHAASPRQQEKSRFLLDRITDYIVVGIISQISQRTKSCEGSRPALSRAFGASFFLSDSGPVPTPEMLLEGERQWKAKEPAVWRHGHIWGSTVLIKDVLDCSPKLDFEKFVSTANFWVT